MIRPCITLAFACFSICLATAETLEEKLSRVNQQYRLPGMAAIDRKSVV